MKVQTRTDRNIENHEGLGHHVENVVTTTLERFSEQVTRVAVHLSDINGGKPGDDDKRCVMEVRLEGHQPIVASDHAGNVHQAIKGAANKLYKALDSALGRLASSKRIPPPPLLEREPALEG